MPGFALPRAPPCFQSQQAGGGGRCGRNLGWRGGPSGSFDAHAAARGGKVFRGSGGCARCHVPPLFSEPGWNLHKPSEIGIDAFQADRSPDRGYRTAPLKGLWTHSKGGFYHDGRFATLEDVVEHYTTFFSLPLAAREKRDLVEYLKSL
jgi:cytochrome c peroxidase